MTNKQAYIFGKKKVRDLNRPVAVPVGVSNVEMIMVPSLKKNIWRMFVKTLDDCIPRTEKLPNGKTVTTDAPFKYPYKKGLAVQSFTKDEKSGVIEIEYVAFPKLFKDTYKKLSWLFIMKWKYKLYNVHNG